VRNWDQTVLSQYANSPRVCSLIDKFNSYVDPDADVELFFDTVWNVDTATGYGLDVLGRRVGITRTVQIPLGIYAGFESALPNALPFGVGTLYSGQALTTPYDVTDDAVFRRMVLACAATNLTDGSTGAINAILMELFPGRGRAYAREEPQPNWRVATFREQEYGLGFGQAPFGDYLGLKPSMMTITLVFEFALAPYERAIAWSSPALPRPAGVRVLVEENP